MGALLSIIPSIISLFTARQQTKVEAEKQKQKQINAPDSCNTRQELEDTARNERDGVIIQLIAIFLFTMPWWSILGGQVFSDYVNHNVLRLYQQLPVQFYVLEVILLGRGIGIKGKDVLTGLSSILSGIFKRK